MAGFVTFALRKATLEDRSALERLIADSARGLSSTDYTASQVEAALGSAFGVDTELIRDGTYFVAEAEGRLVGCGGWSRRATLFGSDAQPERRSELLDPANDSARIRAFLAAAKIRPYSIPPRPNSVPIGAPGSLPINVVRGVNPFRKSLMCNKL